MKRADEVGRDFDEYARSWAEHGYGLETGYSGSGVVREEGSAAVQVPGDEWGDRAALTSQYAALVRRLGLPSPASVVEIGAGGGRSTVALLDALGADAGEYHVIDVAAGFVDTLRERVSRDLDIHIVSDVDVSFLADSSIDLALAQSSWSHINLYDQYRYLRDLRRALRPGAPVVVSGLFLLGAADDWTWNRFRRRVHQIDTGASGVYHEFTSVAMIGEMLARLGYTDVVLFPHGFVARRGALVGKAHRASMKSIRYGYNSDFTRWIATGNATRVRLPVPAVAAPQPTGLTRITNGVARRARRLLPHRG